MRKEISTALLLSFLGLSCTTVFAEDSEGPELDFSLSAELNSKYYWRGFNLSDGNPTLQPELIVGHNDSGLWISLWASQALAGRELVGDSDEIDLTAGFDHVLAESVNLSLGAIFYFYPRLEPDEDSSQELFAGVSFGSVTLSPTFSYYHDIALGDGGYLDTGISHSFGAVSLSSNVGFNVKQYTGKVGLIDLVLGIDYELGLGPSGYLTPFARFALVGDSGRNEENAELWFGVRVDWEP